MDFHTPSCLPAPYEFVDVIVQTFFNDPDGFFTVALLVYIGGFIFQCLINGEEMLHFFNYMGGQLGDVVVAVVIGVIERNGNNLFILLPPSSMEMTPMGYARTRVRGTTGSEQSNSTSKGSPSSP